MSMKAKFQLEEFVEDNCFKWFHDLRIDLLRQACGRRYKDDMILVNVRESCNGRRHDNDPVGERFCHHICEGIFVHSACLDECVKGCVRE